MLTYTGSRPSHVARLRVAPTVMALNVRPRRNAGLIADWKGAN
jgi:hypothetical protein